VASYLDPVTNWSLERIDRIEIVLRKLSDLSADGGIRVEIQRQDRHVRELWLWGITIFSVLKWYIYSYSLGRGVLQPQEVAR
jgi:hypothetical protein